jgi:hypothetical protein
MHNNLLKAGLLALFLVATSFTGWEIYLRNAGLKVDFDDGEALWSYKRSKVYDEKDKSTVFIGSSRIKYDLDIDTWRSLTNDEPVQLAIEGATPLPILHNLADDENFRGRLIVDVTEILFFSSAPHAAFEPNRNLKFYKDLTPSKKFSFQVNHLLENQFVFLDKNNFSTNAMLDKLEIKNRPPVFQMPIFPIDFGRVTFDRQCKMTDKFVADTNLQNQVKGIWDFLRKTSVAPPPSGTQLDSLLTAVKTSVNKIKARGGTVTFIRTPSSGPFLIGEGMGFPRDKFWDRLLKETNCSGVHFLDRKETAGYTCPEFSHLSPSDAIDYTKHLVRILETEYGWKFPKTTNKI